MKAGSTKKTDKGLTNDLLACLSHKPTQLYSRAVDPHAETAQRL